MYETPLSNECVQYLWGKWTKDRNCNRADLGRELQEKFPEMDHLHDETMRKYVSRLFLQFEENNIAPDNIALEETTRIEQNNNTMTISSPKGRVITLEELLEKCNVDKSQREVERHIVNKRDNVMKGDDGQSIITELYQIKARLKKRSGISLEDMQNIIRENLKSYKVSSKKIKYTPSKGILCEINIADPHFGKLARKDETGESYDLKIAEKRYHDTLDDLISKMSIHKPERIIYTVGNDFFHVDGKTNATTAGTLQDVDSRHQKAFGVGLRVCRTSIEKLVKIAPVHIVVVYGNHDEVSSYHLGVLLETLYSDHENITIDNRPKQLKVFEYGKCLLSREHGHGPKENSIPGIIARDYREERGRTIYRECHRGHLHQEKMVDINGFKVRIDPSISGTDARHASKGYGSLKGAKAYVRDKEKGLQYQIHSNV